LSAILHESHGTGFHSVCVSLNVLFITSIWKILVCQSFTDVCNTVYLQRCDNSVFLHCHGSLVMPWICGMCFSYFFSSVPRMITSSFIKIQKYCNATDLVYFLSSSKLMVAI
jgi:hypothetical protein